jgi:hypothetical protein
MMSAAVRHSGDFDNQMLMAPAQPPDLGVPSDSLRSF